MNFTFKQSSTWYVAMLERPHATLTSAIGGSVVCVCYSDVACPHEISTPECTLMVWLPVDPSNFGLACGNQPS